MKEWNDGHVSRFSRGWFTSMYAKRHIYRPEPPTCENPALRAKLDKVALSDLDRDTMAKDVHLMEAAMASDNLIASLEQNVRRRFAQACRKTGEIRHVVWVNPAREEELPLEWLEAARPPNHSGNSANTRRNNLHNFTLDGNLLDSQSAYGLRAVPATHFNGWNCQNK